MFSCRRAVRCTLDLLERRVSLGERLGRWSHLALCRHCRAHSRQVQGLLFVLKSQHSLADSSFPRLSPEARARIAAAVADADPK